MQSEIRDEGGDQSPPWQQELLDSIWLLAGIAILFFILSYVVWGTIELLTLGAG